MTRIVEESFMGSPSRQCAKLSALSLKTFQTKYNVPVLNHPPYSPDLIPCVFYLFPKVKIALKTADFQSIEVVKEKATHVLKGLTEEDFQHCFEQ